MKIHYKKSTEMKQLFTDMDTYVEDGVEYFKGFDLVQPASFDSADLEGSAEYGCQYLVCLDEQERPIGVLKWKRYGLPNHEFVSEAEHLDKDSYIAIRFIDIHRNYRKQGIAKELVLQLSERLDDDFVVGGKATPSGREANIHTWLKRQFTSNYFTNENTLVEEWEEENCAW